MKEIRTDTAWTAEMSNGNNVGLYVGAQDTVVMIFQRAVGEGTLTTQLPVSLECFKTLMALGNRLMEAIHAKEGV